VGPEGEVLGEAGTADWEAAASRVPAARDVWERLSAGIGADGYEDAMLEADDGNILATPLGNRSVLMVLLEPGANAGRVRYEMKKNRDLIESVL
jgi:predicted regulator of Ras-like GTPase activity (Roadblock/LC7/MglB family)